MNVSWGHLSGVVTVVLMLTFVGIWVWAWRPRHKRAFDRLAEMPLEDLEDREDDRGDRDHGGLGDDDRKAGRA